MIQTKLVSVLRRLPAIAFPVAIIVLLTGCASPAVKQADLAVGDYFAADYSQAEALLKPLAKKPDENFVLNNARLGSAALAIYDIDTAQSAFLNAYQVINSVGVNNGGRGLGAVVVSENIRVWEGEPFERAMVNFYLGLIYYMQHDYNNARAAFENALFKLRDNADASKNQDPAATQQSDFALAYLMLGRCYQRLDRATDAQKAFAQAVQLRPYLTPVADFSQNARSNLLLVVDYGYGPRKATNADGAVIGIVPTPYTAGPIPPPAVYVDGRPINLVGEGRPPVDLLALAQDRRWQSMDTIRAVKSGLGTAMIVGGAGYGVIDRHADPYVALGLIAGGLLFKATSQADVRQWEMLPRTTFLLPLYLPPGKHDVMVDFPAIPGLRQEWRGLEVPAQGDATYYYRMQRDNPGPFTWPPGAHTGAGATGGGGAAAK